MGEPHVISALVRKRAYLAGKALDAGEDARQAVLADIACLDRVLVLFDYRDDPNVIPPRRKHVYRFKRNELPRMIRLIEADGETRTNRELALAIMARKGMDVTDRALIAIVVQAVKSQRGWQRRKA
jgi:hypothetical protein